MKYNPTFRVAQCGTDIRDNKYTIALEWTT